MIHNLYKKVTKFTKDYFYSLLIVLICIVLSFLNYTPGTWQTGWDTIHPEFNWSINIPRHLFGIWQDNQGLGSVGGHSHAADISRILILFISDLFLPKSFLRYFYVFLTLIAGPLGTYFFLNLIIFNKVKNREKRNLLSFIGALFYLLNIGTVQQYYVQFEMYTSLYGFLPWVFLYSTKFLLEGKKWFFYLVVSCFLIAPSGYAITVFFSFYVILVIFLLVTSFFYYVTSKKIKYIKRFIYISFLIIFINFYWILPSFYFGANHSEFVSKSYINEHFSEQIFEHNVKNGTLNNLFYNSGFLMDWRNYSFENGQYYPLMEVWNSHLSNPFVIVISISIVIFIVLGLFYSIKSKSRFSIPTLLIFLFSAFMFLNINPPLGFVFKFIQSISPTFEEAFRNPYTKFSIQLIFIYSIFISFGLQFLLQLLKRFGISFKKTYYRLLALILVILFSIYMLPMFKGELISKDVRVDIPKEYFDYFNWMNNQNDSRRIANLPIHSFWGWEYYKWGYQGAGFIWFGTKQPVLARDFDRWNPTNQNYYSEISKAIYSKDVEALEKVIDKYNIGYLVLDKNVFSPDLAEKDLYKNEIKTLLRRAKDISLAKEFGSIEVYHVNDSSSSDISIINSSKDVPIEYPLSSLSKNYLVEEESAINDNYFYLKRTFPSNYFNSNSYLQIPNIVTTEKYISAEVYAKKVGQQLILRLKYIVPQITLNEQNISNSNLYKDFTFNTDLVTSNYAININEEFYDISQIKDSFQNYGSVLFSVDKELNIQVYGLKEGSYLTFGSKDLNFTNCSEGSSSDMVLTDTSLYLASFKNTACAKYTLTNIDSNSIVKVAFKHSSYIKSNFGFCMSFKDNCYVDNLKLIRGSRLQDTYSSFAIPDEKNLQIYIYVPKDLKQGLTTVNFEDLNIQFFSKIGETSLSLISIQNQLSTTEDKINLKELAANKITLSYKYPLISTEYSYSGSELFDYTYLREFVYKDEVKTYQLGGTVYKTAGYPNSIYDTLYISNIPNNLSYLLVLDAQNFSGYPLNVIVRPTYMNKPFLYHRITSKYNAYILPDFTPEQGYYIDFNTLNIDDRITLNKVTSLKLVPFTLNFINSITVYMPSSHNSDINKPKITKVLPFLYKVNNVQKNKVLVLNQSFEKGWNFSGGSNHFSYEGWANAWVTEKGGGYIYFVPVFLQIFLYLLICVYIIRKVISYKRER